MEQRNETSNENMICTHLSNIIWFTLHMQLLNGWAHKMAETRNSVTVASNTVENIMLVMYENNPVWT